MALVDRMVSLQKKLGVLPVTLGVPQYQGKVVLEIAEGQVLIEPNPRVQQVDPKRVGQYLTDTVQVTGEEIEASGIPRDVNEDTLKAARWLLNATWDGSKYIGTRASCLWLDRRNITTYTAILVPRRAK